MNWQAIGLLLLPVLVLPGNSRSQAASFTEAGDAGQIVDFAQEVALVGPVESIQGRIEHAFDVDLFRFIIDEPATFSATAIAAGTDAPDLQLFLFDTWGHGVVANDNWLYSPLPQIPIGTLGGQSPGEYLLGVSAADDDPTGVFGELFPELETGISEPTSSLRFAPLLTWTRDFTAVGGNYLIELTAVRGTTPPLPADFDEDGDVDGDDLTIWQAGYAVGSTHQDGDAEGDGDVDGRDFLIWQRQFGSGPLFGPANRAVPEPTALAILGVGCMVLASRNGRALRRASEIRMLCSLM